jgi:DNA-binding transcriptional ArsR family regulator
MQIDPIVIPQKTSVSVSLGPVQNFFCSLVLLKKTDQYPGLNSWMVDTFRSMTEEEKLNNKIALFGLFYCFLTEDNWSSVPEFLANLETREPEWFQNNLIERYAFNILLDKTKGNPDSKDPVIIDRDKILKNEEAYLDFIKDSFDIRYSDFEIEALSYGYLKDPPKLKSFLISHLTHMWDKYLSKEWEKNRMMLEESVSAFRQMDLSGMDRIETVKKVTNHDIVEEWQEWPWKMEWLKHVKHIVFIPSVHIGPYVVKLITHNTFIIFYGARLPEGSGVKTSDLNRNDINVRMNALADDTRLRILQLISHQGELSSQEIMNQLELSQSATSRHLKQLSATGFLKERRQTCSKVYELNSGFVDKTLNALGIFLQKKP